MEFKYLLPGSAKLVFLSTSKKARKGARWFAPSTYNFKLSRCSHECTVTLYQHLCMLVTGASDIYMMAILGRHIQPKNYYILNIPQACKNSVARREGGKNRRGREWLKMKKGAVKYKKFPWEIICIVLTCHLPPRRQKSVWLERSVPDRRGGGPISSRPQVAKAQPNPNAAPRSEERAKNQRLLHTLSLGERVHVACAPGVPEVAGERGCGEKLGSPCPLRLRRM